MSDLKIGDTIWEYDDNAGRGRHEDLTRAERLRLKFVERKIVGETSRSWLVGLPYNPIKISKKDFTYPTWNRGRKHMFVSPKEVDDFIFLDAHRYQIANVVQRITDAELLREVARLIRYEEGD